MAYWPFCHSEENAVSRLSEIFGETIHFGYSMGITNIGNYILVGGLEHFLLFRYIGNNHPNWLSGVETTNQYNYGGSINRVPLKLNAYINDYNGTSYYEWGLGVPLFMETPIWMSLKMAHAAYPSKNCQFLWEKDDWPCWTTGRYGGTIFSINPKGRCWYMLIGKLANHRIFGFSKFETTPTGKRSLE